MTEGRRGVRVHKADVIIKTPSLGLIMFESKDRTVTGGSVQTAFHLIVVIFKGI